MCRQTKHSQSHAVHARRLSIQKEPFKNADASSNAESKCIELQQFEFHDVKIYQMVGLPVGSVHDALHAGDSLVFLY